MRLARIRFLRYPFCVGRPSEPPNYLDGRDKRDPDAGGGGGNTYARAPAPMNSVTPMQSSPSSSTRSSAPSAPSGSSRSAVYNTERLAEVRLDNQVNGKCSECRLVFDVLDSCLVCGQMLCNKCLLQGFHASCIAYPALDYKEAVSSSLNIDKCGSLDINLNMALTPVSGLNSTDMNVDMLPNLDAYLNEITKFKINSSDPVSPPLVCERCGEDAEHICNTCNHAYCCHCRDHHTCAIIETTHITPVVNMNEGMPAEYSNGPKGHQAPLHDTTVENSGRTTLGNCIYRSLQW